MVYFLKPWYVCTYVPSVKFLASFRQWVVLLPLHCKTNPCPPRLGLRTYNSIQKIETGQGDDYITGCLLDYNYFKDYNKMIELQNYPNLIQQIDFYQTI